jgi:hypothetical protein
VLDNCADATIPTCRTDGGENEHVGVVANGKARLLSVVEHWGRAASWWIWLPSAAASVMVTSVVVVFWVVSAEAACRIYVLLLLLLKKRPKHKGLYGGKGRAKADVF